MAASTGGRHRNVRVEPARRCDRDDIDRRVVQEFIERLVGPAAEPRHQSRGSFVPVVEEADQTAAIRDDSLGMRRGDHTAADDGEPEPVVELHAAIHRENFT